MSRLGGEGQQGEHFQVLFQENIMHIIRIYSALSFMNLNVCNIPNYLTICHL